MIESIGSVIGANTAQLERTAIQTEDFLRILLTQLSFQDPLKPFDNQEFVAQLAEFTNLQQTGIVSQNLEALLTLQSGNQAVGLLGRTVEVATGAGTQIGDVTTITFEGGAPLLTVQTADGSFLTGVVLSQISIVREGAGS